MPADSLYTKYRNAQFRGPTTSDDYNSRLEENYKDLTYLLNKAGQTDDTLVRVFRRFIKDHYSLIQQLNDLNLRIDTLEGTAHRITFGNPLKIDNDRFEDTQWAVPTVNRLTYDDRHGILTLPKVDTSSVSKLKFTNSDGTDVLPSTFEAFARSVTPSVDSDLATIDTSDPYFAIVNQTGKIWERNVIVDSPSEDGAIVDLFVRVPTDLSLIGDSNSIIIHPFPVMGCDLVSVEYSTKPDIHLNDTDDYGPLNDTTMYEGTPEAVGLVPPGGWTGDEIIDCGPKNFYFDPKTVTAIKIRLRQHHYFYDHGKYVYSYGLSNLDVRYDKFLDLGKAMIRYDAPAGETVFDVDNVLPQIFNVSEAEMPDIFDYKLVWETSLNSGVYTEIPPGSPAERVWIEVTLRKTQGKGSPALSGLTVETT